MSAEATQEVPPIVELMRRLDHIGKDGKNDHHNYKFRGIDQMIDSIGPILREFGMFMSTEVVSWEDVPDGVRVRMRYTLFNPDGSVATTLEGLGEGKDKQDKAAYKAMSGAAKYAFGHGLMIPFEGDDPDASDGAGPGRTPAPVASTSGNGGKALAALKAEYEVVLGEADDLGMAVPDAARDFGGWTIGQATKAINKMRGLINEAKAAAA